MLAGHHALVTGAAGGLGQAVASRLAADGAAVAVNDLADGPALRDVASRVGAVPAPADVGSATEVVSMVAEVERQFGQPVDVLVASAAYMTMAPFAEHDTDDWWRVVDTCLGGTFTCVQAVLPGMRRRGGGRIVVVSSEWGIIGQRNASAYAAAKAGLISLTKALGRELAPEGIAVNAVAPSMIDTPQLDVDAADAGVTPAEIRARYAAQAPLGRIATPDEIAAAIAFLADFRLPTLVGQVLHVNGGSTRARA